MEKKINIADILKDKKNGIRLYSPIFGECTFCYVREDTNDICVKKQNGVKEFFDSKGLYYNTGEVMLFPSKEMRDGSNGHFEVVRHCNKCVPHLPTVIHPLFKALDGKVYRANITNVLPFEIRGKYIIEEPVIVDDKK